MIEVERTDFVAVPVDDIRRAEAFYGDTLGLARNPHSSGERWVEFETGNLTIALSQFGAAIGLRVSSVDEARATLEDAGVEFGNDTFDSGVCNGAGFKDPDGNALLLHRRYAPLEAYVVAEQEVQRADFVGVFTTDLSRAEPFYENVLGLTRDPNHTEGWPDFDTGNVSLLITDVAKTGQDFRPNGGAIALRVEDVGASMERLKGCPLRFRRGLRLGGLPHGVLQGFGRQRTDAPPPIRAVQRRDPAVTRFVLVATLVVCAVTAGAADAGRPGRWEVVASGANAPAVSQELGVARTGDGSLHVAWREGFDTIRARTITAAGVLGPVSTVVSGWDLGADPTLIASTGVRALFAGVTPVEGLNTSTASSASSAWSPPALVDDREFARGRTAGAAVLPSGSPILTWYSAGDIVVRSGVTPGAPLFTLTAGGSNTRPNVAADAGGNALVAWCEFTGGTRGVFVQRVGANGVPAGGAVKLPGSTTPDATGVPQAACVLESTVSRREPLVARVGGGFFVAGTSGYPSLNRVLVWRLDASGNVAGSTVVAGSTTASFAEPAIAAAPDGRIWVAWLEPVAAGKRIVARRSNRAGTVFGAPVRAVPPGGVAVGTVNLDAQADRVDVLAIAQSTAGARSVQHTQLLPGLTIVRTSLVRRRGSASVTFRVLDAGDPVAGARVRAAGQSGVTNARGTVTLVVRRGGTATATRAGYVAGSTRFACCR